MPVEDDYMTHIDGYISSHSNQGLATLNAYTVIGIPQTKYTDNNKQTDRPEMKNNTTQHHTTSLAVYGHLLHVITLEFEECHPEFSLNDRYQCQAGGAAAAVGLVYLLGTCGDC